MNASIQTHIFTIVPLIHTHMDVIQEYWQRLYMHDLLKYRLCDIEDPTWSDVKNMIQRMGNWIFFVNLGHDIVGEFMLENFTGYAAQIHFSVNPEQRHHGVAAARWSTNHIIEYWQQIDTLFGLTPTTNRAARIFNRRAGFKEIGILPKGMRDRGQIVDGHIMVKTIESRRESWAVKVVADPAKQK